MENKLPTNFVVEFDGFRRLTFKERLLILIGYNLTTLSKVIVNRRGGSVKAHTAVVLTKQLSAEGQTREQEQPV